MVNPNKHIRKAYILALADIGVPVWSVKVPKTIKPKPTRYVLISSQSKTETVRDKCGFEWLCVVTLDITSVQNLGDSDVAILDDIEEKILSRIDDELPVTGFIVKSAVVLESIDVTLDTPNQSVERRIIMYEHWLNNV